MDPEDFKFGMTKIFFRPGKVNENVVLNLFQSLQSGFLGHRQFGSNWRLVKKLVMTS